MSAAYQKYFKFQVSIYFILLTAMCIRTQFENTPDLSLSHSITQQDFFTESKVMTYVWIETHEKWYTK